MPKFCHTLHTRENTKKHISGLNFLPSDFLNNFSKLDIVCNKTANGTCSKDISRTTTISEMGFFVAIVNRDNVDNFHLLITIFQLTINFKFQVFFNNLGKVLQTDCLHVNTNFVRCLQQFLNLWTPAYNRFLYVWMSVSSASYKDL